MKLLRLPGSVFILLLSFLALSLSTSVPLAWAKVGDITEFPIPSAPAGITAGPDGDLWFTELQANRIGRINPSSGDITEFSTGLTARSAPRDITASPDGDLWFTELQGNWIGRINPSSSNTITEFPIPSAPRDITASPDGDLWFTELQANRIGRINPSSGDITEFSTGLTARSAPAGITAGPDGNLWFTEFQANRIGHLSTT